MQVFWFVTRSDLSAEIWRVS